MLAEEIVFFAEMVNTPETRDDQLAMSSFP
jgi:hypothetical protein